MYAPMQYQMATELATQRQQELIEEAQLYRWLSELRQDRRQPKLWVHKLARFAESFVERFKLAAPTTAQF